MARIGTSIALAAMIATLMGIAPHIALAQQAGPPARGSSEVGNFGDVPFSNPQIVITRAEDRAAWRKLEDKHLKERRDIEDKYETELRAMRARQADERESLVKNFAR